MCLLGLGFMRIDHQRMEGAASGYEDERPVVVVANHTSWIDILLLIWLYSPSFVARKGTESMTFVGRVASEELNCIFVDREAAKSSGAAELVRERILQNVDSRAALKPFNPMLLFPEGTTTNGKYLLEFRTGAFVAGAPVKPILLQYGESSCGFSPAWETLGAAQHIFHTLASPLHRVTVTELPTYHPSDEERKDPATFAANVRNVFLRANPDLIPSSSTYADKRVYHALLEEQARGARRGLSASPTLPLMDRSAMTPASEASWSSDGASSPGTAKPATPAAQHVQVQLIVHTAS